MTLLEGMQLLSVALVDVGKEDQQFEVLTGSWSFRTIRSWGERCQTAQVTERREGL